jgi:hypothetical protein
LKDKIKLFLSVLVIVLTLLLVVASLLAFLVDGVLRWFAEMGFPGILLLAFLILLPCYLIACLSSK